MKCKHDTNFLIGTANGILCRGCGQLFKTFDALKADAGDAQPVEEPEKKPAPKRGRKKKEES